MPPPAVSPSPVAAASRHQREYDGHCGARGRVIYAMMRCRAVATAHAVTMAATGKPSVVFASEPMDEDPGWRVVEPGTLFHVDADLAITMRVVLPEPPERQLSRADLSAKEAASQHPSAAL